LGAGESVDGFARIIINYLEIPINVGYKIGNFHVIAGPYLAFGLSGKVKVDYTETYNGDVFVEKFEDDIKFKGKLNETDWNSDNAYAKGLDYGLSFGLGYSAGPMMINAGYGLGLANLTSEIDVVGVDFKASDEKRSNSVMNLSVSYFFGQK
jgi:hypothetical protein